MPRRGRDSIWIAWTRGLANPETREEATGLLRALLRAWVARGLGVLVGWDFPIGYPDGLARRLRARGPLGILRAVAREVHDDAHNRNDRFAAAARLNRRARADLFWGAPPNRGVPVKRPRLELAEFRLCEIELQRRRLRPHSPWKLYTAGSCGGQALTGLPRLLSLRDDPMLRKASRVWPLETGFVLPRARPLVVHAEIWPTGVGWDPALHPVRDAAQVLSVVRFLQAEDAGGRLGMLFGPPAGVDLRVARREGWVLGRSGLCP